MVVVNHQRCAGKPVDVAGRTIAVILDWLYGR